MVTTAVRLNVSRDRTCTRSGPVPHSAIDALVALRMYLAKKVPRLSPAVGGVLSVAITAVGVHAVLQQERDEKQLGLLKISASLVFINYYSVLGQQHKTYC